jgi:hypothetical protein
VEVRFYPRVKRARFRLDLLFSGSDPYPINNKFQGRSNGPLGRTGPFASIVATRGDEAAKGGVIEVEAKTMKMKKDICRRSRKMGYSVCGHQVVWHRLTGAFLRCNHIAVPQVDGVNH